jgi:hypothetical protein
LDSCKKPLGAGSTVVLRERNSGGGKRLSWRWSHGEETSIAEFGDPRTVTAYTLCVFQNDPSSFVSTSLVLQARVPADGTCNGEPCWRPTNTGYRYLDHALTNDGVQSIVLNGGPPGAASITVEGKGARLPSAPLPLDPPVTVELRAEGGACWNATYTMPSKNTAAEFRARSE